MRKITVVLSGFLIVLALAGLQISHVSAVETSGIGALPAHPHLDNPRTKSIFVYDVASGDVLTDGIRVVNNTDSTKTLAVYPVDSQASSDGAFACAQKVDPKTEVGSWIKLTQDQVKLSANTSQVVPFTLTVPTDVKSGEHNGCIVVQDADPASKKAGNGIVLSFRSALRVAVTTPGALQANLSFVDVKTRDVNRKTLGISPILQNKGNVSVDANLDIKLTGIFWLHYPFVRIGGQFPAFPDDQSRFNFEVKKPFWGGWYNRDVQATYKKPVSSGRSSNDVTTIEAKNAILYITPQPLALAIEAFVVFVIILPTIYVARRLWLFRQLRRRSTGTYTVQQGDTIESIAKHFTITWRQLAKINSIQSPYILHTGQIIKVPAVHVDSNSPKQEPPKPDVSNSSPPNENANADQSQGKPPPITTG